MISAAVFVASDFAHVVQAVFDVPAVADRSRKLFGPGALRIERDGTAGRADSFRRRVNRPVRRIVRERILSSETQFGPQQADLDRMAGGSAPATGTRSRQKMFLGPQAASMPRLPFPRLCARVRSASPGGDREGRHDRFDSPQRRRRRRERGVPQQKGSPPRCGCINPQSAPHPRPRSRPLRPRERPRRARLAGGPALPNP